jgi:hypothetical protein
MTTPDPRPLNEAVRLLRTIRNVLVFWTAVALTGAVVGLLWFAALGAS